MAEQQIKRMGYSQKEFADMFGFSTVSVCNWVKEGKIPIVEYVDGVKRIPASFVSDKVQVSEGKLVIADQHDEYRKWFSKLSADEKLRELARLTVA